MLKSFDSLLNNETRILIIGTMPGAASLAANEYYAYPRNVFWRIISDIFNNGKAFTSYEEKIQCLLTNGIGLWDNLLYCERKSSLDSDIKNEYPNDFESLLTQHPKIKTLLFNGQKSFSLFKKYHSELLNKLNWQQLPSTSPTNARLSYVRKNSVWRKAILAADDF